MFIFFIKIIFISFILHESLLTWWLSYVTYSAFDEYQACMTSMQKTNVMMRDYGFNNGLACCKLRKIWKSDYHLSYHEFCKTELLVGSARNWNTILYSYRPVQVSSFSSISTDSIPGRMTTWMRQFASMSPTPWCNFPVRVIC